MTLKKLGEEVTGKIMLSQTEQKESVKALLQKEALSLQTEMAYKEAAQSEKEKEIKMEEEQKQRKLDAERLEVAKKEAAAAMEKAVQEKAKADEAAATQQVQIDAKAQEQIKGVTEQVWKIFQELDVSDQGLANRKDITDEVTKLCTTEPTIKAFIAEIDALNAITVTKDVFEDVLLEWVSNQESRPRPATRIGMERLFDKLDEEGTQFVPKRVLLKELGSRPGAEKLITTLKEALDHLLERADFMKMVMREIQDCHHWEHPIETNKAT